MKYTVLSAACITALFSFPVYAQHYQFDVGASFVSGEKRDTSGITTTSYFQKVNTTYHPLAEAAYLEKNSNLQLNLYQSEYSSSTRANEKELLVDSKIEFYVPSLMLYIAPHFSHTEIEKKSQTRTLKDNIDEWGISVGVTPINGLRVSTTWSDDVDYATNLDLKYVTSLMNDQAINLELNYSSGAEGESNSLSGAMDLYLNRMFSVGFSVLKEEERTYQFRTTRFITHAFHVSAFYQNTGDNDYFGIGAGFRF